MISLKLRWWFIPTQYTQPLTHQLTDEGQPAQFDGHGGCFIE
ncbi:MAG: hypothetical protein WD469_08995 [Paenibacillaceae bacterium]